MFELTVLLPHLQVSAAKKVQGAEPCKRVQQQRKQLGHLSAFAPEALE